MQKHPFDRRGSLDVQESRLEEVFKNCSAHANANYDVAGLCPHFPNRWQELIDSEGDRLER